MLTVESFSAVVHTIQDAATAPEGWKNALREILEVIGASAGGLMVEGGEGTPDIVANIDADPASLEAYRRYYCRLDPIMPALLKAPEQSVLTQNMVMERSKMMRTEFYNDWLRPQQLDDCLAATVSGDGRAGVLAFAVSARVGYFKADAIQVMQLLAPHVNFAVRANRQLCGLSLQRNGAVAALDHLSCGVFFVDDMARVAWANRAGDALLAEGDGLAVGRGSGLEAATRTGTAMLRRLIGTASGSTGQPVMGGSLTLDRPSGEQPLMVTVTPIKRDYYPLLPAPACRAMVLVATPRNKATVSSDLLQNLFGLTSAEAKVAKFIAQGLGIKAAAASLGTAPSTVKTHLLRVFAKTGTARQAELVQLLSPLFYQSATNFTWQTHAS